MICDNCIHKTVCYRTDSVSSSYADRCGDFKTEKTGYSANSKYYIELDQSLIDRLNPYLSIGGKLGVKIPIGRGVFYGKELLTLKDIAEKYCLNCNAETESGAKE